VREWHADALARQLVATYQDVVATYPAARAGLLSGMRGQRLPSPIAMPLHYMRKL